MKSKTCDHPNQVGPVVGNAWSTLKFLPCLIRLNWIVANPGWNVGAYVIETNVNGVYRTYMYSNPNLSKCHQSQKILTMDEIFREEFELFPKSKQ